MLVSLCLDFSTRLSLEDVARKNIQLLLRRTAPNLEHPYIPVHALQGRHNSVQLFRSRG
jgi:hypothetical protein